MDQKTKSATFRFYAELNYFLKPADRFNDITLPFKGRQTVKHLIESLGIPHPEVDLILVNGISVGFGHIAGDNDRITVYPVFETINITDTIHLRPAPLRVTRFILDGHLGRLAAYLRMLGFDVQYHNDSEDASLAVISISEKRILLTRDRGLLKRKAILRGTCLRAVDPYQQLLEIVRRFDLIGDMRPFTRCMACNGVLHEVEKADILHLLQPMTKKYFDTFKQCPDCGRVYWRGSHHDRMSRLIDHLKSDIARVG